MFAAAELGRRVSKADYEARLPVLRTEMLHAQERLKRADFPLLVLIHGCDAAGKGRLLNLLHEWMDPRFLLTEAFGAETEEERQRPPYWRFWQVLPPKGRIGIFVGSWYTEPIVGRVYGRLNNKGLEAAVERIRGLEQALVADGMLLIKFWFHLSKTEQRDRLEELEQDPRTNWRVTKTDWENHRRYDRFRKFAERVLLQTSTSAAPWRVVEATDWHYQALTVGENLLELLDKRLAGGTPHRAAAPPGAVRRGRPASILDRLDLSKRLDPRTYAAQLARWQGRLNQLCRKAQKRGLSSILVFEGWDAAGKGGVIRRLTGALDARQYRVIPIAAPSEEERARHYLWRFWRHLPRAGRVTVFDRSWYGRVMVERVEGFATEAEWSRAYEEINEFEAQLTEFGCVLLKFFLHIDRREQLRRFRERERTPWKRFKITPEDYRNRAKWDLYQGAVNEMLDRTATARAPWTLVEAEDKCYARIKVLKTFCARLEEALAD